MAYAGGEVVLRLSRRELEDALGPLSAPSSWHKIEQRVSRYNAAAKTLGVKLSTRRAERVLEARAPRADALRELQKRLREGPGHVQRRLGLLLERKLGEAADPVEALRRRQTEELDAALSSSLSALGGLGPLMRAVHVDAPFALEGAPSSKTALDSARAVLSGERGLAVVGLPGAGKTALLRRLLEAAPRGARAVYLPARTLRWNAAGDGLDWARVLPRESAGLAERLEADFAAGRLLLLVDGLDDRPDCLDLSEPAAAAFWAQAARNRCAFACRDLFFERHVRHSALHKLFGGRLSVLALKEWTPAHAGRLFARAAEGGAALLPGVESLAKLSAETLEAKLSGMRLTPLVAWSYAAFFCRRRGGAFPRNEFEVLDYQLDQLLAWERERLAEAVPEDVARGVLQRAGWACYQNGLRDGGLGEDSWMRASELMELLRRDFPFHADRGAAVFEALIRLPAIRFDGVHGSLRMERTLCCLLAARHLLSLAERGDARLLAECFETPLVDAPTRLLYQGIELLGAEGRRRFFETGRRAFDLQRAAFARERKRGPLTAMQGLLQPLARLEVPEAGRWLRSLLDQAEKFPGEVALSCGRALSYLRDEEGVTRFLDHLRRVPEAAKVNRAFYLYWLKDAEPTEPADSPDLFLKLEAKSWGKAAAWLEKQLESRESLPLRRVHLFTYLDLWAKHGPSPASKPRLRALCAALEAEAAARPALASDVAALRRKIR